MGLLPNRLCDENSKFRAKISKRDDAYLAKIRGGAVCNLQPKFRICSRSLLGNSPFKVNPPYQKKAVFATPLKSIK